MTVAAPYVEATETSQGAAVTTLPVVLPTSSIVSLDQIYVAVATDDVTVTAPSASWNLVKEDIETGVARVAFYWYSAVGGESGSTVDFTADVATPFSAVSMHVTGGAGALFAVSGPWDGTGAYIGFNDLDPVWSEYETLWVAIGGWADDDAAVVSFPFSFVHSQDWTVSGGGANAGCGIGVSTRRLRSDVASGDVMQIDASQAWVSFTVGIRPSAVAVAAPPSGNDLVALETSVKLDQDWHGIPEGSIYRRDPVNLRIGRSDWASQAEPSSCRMTLDNRDGTWSPDNEAGPWHGHFGRNVPLRVGAGQADAYLQSAGSVEPFYSAGCVASADTQFDIVGDIDIRFFVEATRDLFLGEKQLIARKPLSWRIYLYRAAAGLSILWEWEDSSGQHTYDSIDTGVALPWEILWRRMAVRITLDVSTGEGLFYCADTFEGPYTQLGAGVTTAGATDIVSAATDLQLLHGAPYSDIHTIFSGKMYRFRVLDGIGGVVVADIDFTGQAPGEIWPVGADGFTWSVKEHAKISATRWRFHGEIASLPLPVSLSGSDQWVPLEANGLLRRLHQGQPLLASPIRRAYERQQVSTGVVSYWPMEEAGGSTLETFGPAVGGSALRLISGTPNPGSANHFISSAPIATLDDSRWKATVDQVASTGEFMVRFLLSAPSDHSTDVELFRMLTGDVEWVLTYKGNGQIQMTGYQNGVLTLTGTSWQFDIDGIPVRFSCSFEPNGANIDVTLDAANVGDAVSGGGTDALGPAEVTWPVSIDVNPQGDCGPIGFGHLVVESTVRTGDLVDDLEAFAGEAAAVRVERLCLEEGIPSRVQGDPAESIAMGPQGRKTLVELLKECAATDLGVLYDPQEVLGVGYRTGATLRNQSAAIEVAYSVDTIDAPGLLHDDQELHNDVTVTNWDKSTAKASLESGDLSVLEPPYGAGRYATTYDVSDVNPSENLQGHAATRLRLGTVASPRMPIVKFGLHSDLSADQKSRLMRLRPGDKLSVSGLPPLVHGDITQLAQGWSERIDTHVHELVVNTSSAEPWDTGLIQGVNGIVYPLAGSFPLGNYVSPSVSPGVNGVEYEIRPGGNSAADLAAAQTAIDADTNRGGHVVRFLAGEHPQSCRFRGNLIGGSLDLDGANGKHNTVVFESGAYISATGVYPALDFAATKYWDCVDVYIASSDFAGIRYQYSGGDSDSRTKILGPRIENCEHSHLQIQGWWEAPWTPSLYWDVEGYTIDGKARVRTVPEWSEGIYIGRGDTEWVDYSGHGTIKNGSIANIESDSIELKTGVGIAGVSPMLIEDFLIHGGRLVAGSGGTSIPVGHVSLVYANTSEPGGDSESDIVLRRGRIYDMEQASGVVRPTILVGRGGTEVYSVAVWDSEGIPIEINSGAGGMGTGVISVDGNTGDKALVTNTDSYGSLVVANNVPDQFDAEFVGPVVGTADNGGQGAGSGFAITSHAGAGVGVGRYDVTNSAPNSPLDPGAFQLGAPGGPEMARYDTSGSIVASGERAGATTVYVATEVGPLWTTDVADFPFDAVVDGLRVLVEAITGSVSPQVFTVAAIGRRIEGGADVRLADPTTWSF